MESDMNWKGKWIWRSASPEQSGEHQNVYFRRTFEVLSPAQCRFVARVSADSRYRLYMNGKSIGTGPCKGDRYTHYYETIDLSAYLVPGANVLAVQVLHYAISEPFKLGIGGPASVWRSQIGAFLFDGVVDDLNGNVTIGIHSDENWKCQADNAIRFHPGELETMYVGGTERVDGRLLPFGWQQPDYDDKDWEPAVSVSKVMDTSYGQLTPWTLTPRPIPELYELHKGFARVKRHSEGFVEPVFHSFLAEPLLEGYKIGSGRTFWVELDAGELTTGYPFLEIRGGRDAQVNLLYSECYEEPPVTKGKRNKNIRDDQNQGMLIGEKDSYTVAGWDGQENPGPERYEPFSFRTFRFVRVEIAAGEQPLEIVRFNYRETGYPLEVISHFQSSDASLSPLWDISINTLKRCMHETYEDCPYYEQMQYTMDTRLQALFTYSVSGDDRLARRALFDFHSSKLPNGMLQSRYPSVYPQVIPGFSIYWILMLHDHYSYFADLPLVRTYLPTVDGVLGWFETQLTPEGLVGRMPDHYWSFVDWVEDWRDHRGVPLAHKSGPLTVYGFLYIVGLQAAAQLNREAGRTSTADEYDSRAHTLKQAIKKGCWSEAEGLFRDGPAVEQYSQHAQIWAVLSETVEGEAANQLMDRMLAHTSLSKVSYAMAFYLFRALSKTGKYNKSFPLWDVWRQLADLKLTTWVEDPVSQRSDCHGWGAVPLYEFTTEILGVKSDGFGFRKLLIAPQLGELSWAKGNVATPSGLVQVEWERLQDGLFRIFVCSPKGTPVIFELPNGERMERPDGGSYERTVELKQSDA